MAASYKPEGYHTVTPYATVEDVDRLLQFLKQAFGAEELGRYATPDGRIMHAAVRIGDSVVEMGEPGGEFTPRPVSIHLYVEDVDAVYARAVEAGALTLNAPRDEFYGERSAGIDDPCGNRWYIATRVRDVSDEELQRHAEPAVS